MTASVIALDKDNIRELLQKEFPGKTIIDLPLEVICETEPATDHPDWSQAIAYIKRSEPHYHNKTTEVYRVEKGTLHLVIDGQEYLLMEGEHRTVEPPAVHHAYGEWARVRVYTEPGWTEEDHLLTG